MNIIELMATIWNSVLDIPYQQSLTKFLKQLCLVYAPRAGGLKYLCSSKSTYQSDYLTA